MIDRSIYELESSSYQHLSKGGVAPSRYQMAMHHNQHKRLGTFEAEEIEKRRQRSEARADASIKILSRVARAVMNVLNAKKLRPRQELK